MSRRLYFKVYPNKDSKLSDWEKIISSLEALGVVDRIDYSLEHVELPKMKVDLSSFKEINHDKH